MKMRKTLVALTLALAMCVTGITMTGCGKIDYIGFDSYEGDSEGKVMSSEMTVKQFLEANPDAIWFRTPKLDKDYTLKETTFYRFEGGKAYVYYYDDEITLSEVADLTVEQLEESTMKHWEKEIERETPEIDQPEEFVLNWEVVVDAWKKFASNLDIKRDLASPKPYTFSVFTDESGNNVEYEAIGIPRPEIDSNIEFGDPVNDIFEPAESCEYYVDDSISSTYVYGGGYMGEIYDTKYGGFTLNNDSMFITKIDNPDIYIVLDELGTEGIAVDPK